MRDDYRERRTRRGLPLRQRLQFGLYLLARAIRRLLRRG
jgi:hypothetical protein